MKLQFPWNFQLARPTDWWSIKWTCWRWELETSEGIEAANSNARHQGTAGPSVRPFCSFCESMSRLYSDIQCKCCVPCVSNAFSLLGHALRFIFSTVTWMTVFHFHWWDQVPSSGWDFILMSSGRDLFSSSVEICLPIISKSLRTQMMEN